MDTTTHPTGAAHINREALATLVAKAGPERVRTLLQLFVGKNGVWFLDIGLFLFPVSLTQVTNQVAFRVAGEPLRHLPLPMHDAKIWAAAWVILMAEQAGQDVDGAMKALASWVGASNSPTEGNEQTQATIDFAPILADFPESVLDSTGRPDIRAILEGFPTMVHLNGTTITLRAWVGGVDPSVHVSVLERLVRHARWADALLMRWMQSPSGKAWAQAHG
jgi:hypothetical protein